MYLQKNQLTSWAVATPLLLSLVNSLIYDENRQLKCSNPSKIRNVPLLKFEFSRQFFRCLLPLLNVKSCQNKEYLKTSRQLSFQNTCRFYLLHMKNFNVLYFLNFKWYIMAENESCKLSPEKNKNYQVSHIITADEIEIRNL